jgi:shikimate dehydrogenase
MRQFGLIGYPLGHSFSKRYFTRKFELEGIKDARYDNFELESVQAFPQLLQAHPNLKGLNVTIPYKQSIIPFLDDIDFSALMIRAVNTVKFTKGKTKGYNTDYIGFRDSIKPLLQPQHTKALVLGTGGSSKAVVFALTQMGIEVQQVSREPKDAEIGYAAINAKAIQAHTIIVNTTPLGMYPNVEAAPEIPYQHLTNKHLLFDLVYNPAETLFLQKGKAQGAIVKNGQEMLELQAEAAWKIWNS